MNVAPALRTALFAMLAVAVSIVPSLDAIPIVGTQRAKGAGAPAPAKASQPAPGGTANPATPVPATLTFVDTTATGTVVDGSTLSLALVVLYKPATNAPAPEANTLKVEAKEPAIETSVLLRSAKGKLITSENPKVEVTAPLPAGTSMVRFSTTVKADRADYPLNGVLVMRLDKTQQGTVTLSSIGFEDPSDADWVIFWNAGGLALVCVGIAAVILLIAHGGAALTTPMGPAGSSLADGWSAALMIGGPILTAAFALTAFPEYPASMTKKGYLIVSFLLSTIISVAPNIFGLLKVPKVVTDLLGNPSTQNQGVSGLFLLSAVFTLTGCLGQLALLQLVFQDLTSAHALSSPLGAAIHLLLTVLWVSVAFFGIVAAINTVNGQFEVKAKQEEAAAAAAAAAKAAADAAKAAAENIAQGRPQSMSQTPVTSAAASSHPQPLPGWSPL